MKKIMFYITAVILLCCFISGCGKNSQFTESMNVTVPQSPALHAAATIDDTPDFSFVYQYGTADENELWLWCSCGIENAALCAAEADQVTGKTVPGEIIYAFGDVLYGEGIALYTLPAGSCAVFCYTAAGQDYSYVIGLNSDGSVILEQIFEPEYL